MHRGPHSLLPGADQPSPPPRSLRDDSMYVHVRVEGPAEQRPLGRIRIKGLRGQDVLRAAGRSCSRGREVM